MTTGNHWTTHTLDVARLADAVDTARRDRGLNTLDFSRETGLSALLPQWLRYGIYPDADELITLATWLDVDIRTFTRERS